MKRYPVSWGWIGLLSALGAVAVSTVVVWPWFLDAKEPDKPAATPAPFDADRSMKYLEAVCKIGPRVSGTDGMKKQQKLMEKHFADLGATVTYQKFMSKQRGKKSVEMANMVASWQPEKLRRAILCCHYDTRPIADQEEDPRKWREPFLSANDGGSGVALLMELAHAMKEFKTEVGVDFVFFDGEEYIDDPRQDEEFYFLGSRQFVRENTRSKKKTKYVGAILLDMIAGKGASFPREQNSLHHAGKLTKEVWAIAAELKADAFAQKGTSKVAVNDDHVPMNEGGIPTVDIIDFEFPHWHRLGDTPKNCSANPMKQVADVCSVWLQRQK